VSSHDPSSVDFLAWDSETSTHRIAPTPAQPVPTQPDAPNLGTALALNDTRVPAMIQRSDARTLQRFLHFFCASIRNVNTRAAYSTAVQKFFDWCEQHGVHELETVRKLHVSAYIEQLTHDQAAPTVKQNLSALRSMFEYVRMPLDNPAEGVRGPKHSCQTGRTPVITAEQARRLLDSIDTSTVVGLRDKALIAIMIYTFGRVSAVVGMELQDYYLEGTRRWCRLHEKGGKTHAVPLHYNAEEYVEAYLQTANLAEAKGPLFRTVDKKGDLTRRPMSRHTAWEMVKRRAKAAKLPPTTTNHSFRAAGITTYLENGGSIETAKRIAAHASVKTTQMYDRRDDRITMDEICRIRL
jgi:integrase/recombinase XerD